MPSSVSPERFTATVPPDAAKSQLKAPLEYTGSLDTYTYTDLTPVLGRQYNRIQILDLLKDDVLLRDLAVIVSRRGVVFLKNQDVSPIQLTEFTSKLSQLTGAPKSSGLHIHPLTEENSELGDQVQVISSEKQRRGGRPPNASALASGNWHSDITFEPVPSDYAALKIHTLPETGGDTLWTSGYEIYDRLSPALQRLLEGCTATHDAKFFGGIAKRLGQGLRTEARGSVLNVGDELEAVHPVIRTNPVTGWKSVFVNKGFTRRINELTRDESDVLLQYLFTLVTNNHDAQVRFKWSKNDVAVWDNRSNYHAATFDYDGVRIGDRACSLGEKPFYDPKSVSRRDALRV